MRPRDIRRREDNDLNQEIKRLHGEIFEQRFRGHSEEKADRGRVRKDRRDIARIRTIQRERTLGLNQNLEAESRKGGK